jgi:hypothetical protein
VGMKPGLFRLRWLKVQTGLWQSIFRGEELTVMGHEAMICFLLRVLIFVHFDAFPHTAFDN